LNQNLNANITVFRHLNANDRTFVNKVVISSEKVFANETIGSERKKNPDFNSLVQKYEYKDMTFYCACLYNAGLPVNHCV
jgi:hypothetical protein